MRRDGTAPGAAPGARVLVLTPPARYQIPVTGCYGGPCVIFSERIIAVIKDIPQGISRLLLARGAVYLRCGRARVDDGLSLVIADARSHFTVIDETEIADFDVALEYRPEFDPDDLGIVDAGRGGGADVDAMLNGLPDWTLADRPTLQLRLPKTGALNFAVTDPIVLPAHGEALEFSAHLGAHRAAGRLHVELTDSGGTRLFENSFPFDNTRHGGRFAEGYRAVGCALPRAPNVATTLRLTIYFDRFTGTEDEGEPFLFVADPHVHRQAAPGALPAEDLHDAPGADARSLVWARAPLPRLLEAGEALGLADARDHITILKTGGSGRMQLLSDHGHTLRLQASEIGRYQFHVDGQPAFLAHVGTDPTPVRIPNQWFNGKPRQLSVWDIGGSQRLLTSYVLMPRTLTPIDILQTESRTPFPDALAPQAAHRLRSLKAQLAAGHDPDTLAQVARAVAVLDGGHANVTLEPLRFPAVDKPEVSVVIPAHNKVEVTYLALASLLAAPNRASFEVIVVDDASTDATAGLEKIVKGLKIHRNERPQRFVRACNAGAELAQGKYIALLNNDVEVTAGWLDALVDAFDRFDDVGLVGSKLVYPDGRLQDAGGIVWGSGLPWNYGNGANPWDPRFCYARQVDYLSGAAMMTSREIWDKVGGLSAYLEPMYFEDTDFAFKVREAGFTTWFVPASVVFHYEGMTSGTDTGSGFKRYQEVNQPKFRRRWAAAYRGNGRDETMIDREKDRGIAGRVLFIDHGFPRPDRDAGSYAAVAEMRLVQQLGFKVTFLPRNLAHLGDYTDALERMGVETVYAPFALSPTDFIATRGAEFDAIYITRYAVAQDMLPAIRQHAPQAPVLFNNADLHFLRELRAGVAAGDPEMIAAAAETRQDELAVMADVDVVLSYNETEHAVIASHTEGAVTAVRCPWVVETPAKVPPLKRRKGISFLGNYQHFPNAEGVEWFVRQVMPLLAGQRPNLTFHIYGAAMTDALRDLESDRIHPEGFVADLADAYGRHRVFVAPLLSGAGIKGKVLSALAHGIPCVLSPVAAEGIGLRHGLDCMIARDPADWAAAIATLDADDALWTRLSDNARAYVRAEYSVARGLEHMRAAFEAADIFPPPPRG